jgi:hypothetical protein
MSDRPSAVNGKRNKAWGTRDSCPACGQCLCFGCHPTGPCVDEHIDAPAPSSGDSAAFTSVSQSSTPGAWYASGPSIASGASGLRMRAASDASNAGLR